MVVNCSFDMMMMDGSYRCYAAFFLLERKVNGKYIKDKDKTFVLRTRAIPSPIR